MKPFHAIAFALLAGLASTPALAQIREDRDVTVAPGETTRLWGWSNFDTNCRTTGLAEFTFSTLPGNAELQIRNEDIPIRNVSSDDRAHCIGRTVQGRRVYLTARSNARGSERFVMYQNRGTPNERQVNFTVHYR